MAYTNIDDPSAYFQAKTYTGNAIDDTPITNDGNSNLQADWIWFKRRSSVENHVLADSTRGVTKWLFTNLTSAEGTSTARLKSFDTNGFTLGDTGSTNQSGGTFVAWQWKCNAGSTSSNADGSITSTVQANTDAGFSIVTYSGNSTSGATIGHGLGVAPNWIIVKARTLGGNWMVGSTALDSTLANRCILNSTAAASSNTGDFNAAPTSSVFQLGTSLDVNSSTKTYIAYCFAEKQGFSKFGKYVGNGARDGVFVYTGFQPAFVMIKCSSAAGGRWTMFDNKRAIANGDLDYLVADADHVESDAGLGYTDPIDLVSNGFKIRNSDLFTNQSGTSYIYMAFAQHPFTTSTGIPTTAR